MSKKFCPFVYSNSLCENLQHFLDREDAKKNSSVSGPTTMRKTLFRNFFSQSIKIHMYFTILLNYVVVYQSRFFFSRLVALFCKNMGSFSPKVSKSVFGYLITGEEKNPIRPLTNYFRKNTMIMLPINSRHTTDEIVWNNY